MDLVGIKKKIDKTISNPVIRNEAQCYSVDTPLSFLSDDVIGRSWFFRLIVLVFYYCSFIHFHGGEGKINWKNYFKI
jgi:hypothetical protein